MIFEKIPSYLIYTAGKRDIYGYGLFSVQNRKKQQKHHQVFMVLRIFATKTVCVPKALKQNSSKMVKITNFQNSISQQPFK